MWVIPSSAVTGLDFGSDGRIQAIALDCSFGASWTAIEFDLNTAFLAQNKNGSRNNIAVSQQVRFTETVMTQAHATALMRLSRCCSLHAVVLDNTGRYHYIGISTYLGNQWQSERLQSAEGYGNTGADRTADVNEFSETLQATTNTYAPQLTASPLEISTDCTGVTIFGTSPDGTIAFGTSIDGDTVFGTEIHP